MAVKCLIRRDDRPTEAESYFFDCLPRIGESVRLEGSDEEWPYFLVYKILHVPHGIEESVSFTAIFVKKDAAYADRT